MLNPEYDRVLIIGESKDKRFSWHCVPKENVLKIIKSSMDFSKFKIETETLCGLFNAKGADESDFQPAIYVDADKKALYSQFPEPPSFEEHVVEPWKGYYEDFTGLIPEGHRYWDLRNKTR